MQSNEITKKLVNHYIQRFPADAALTFNSIKPAEILDYLRQQAPDDAKELLVNLTPDVVSKVLQIMDRDVFTELFSTMDPYVGAKLISRLHKDLIAERLKLLPPRVSRTIREMLSYPPEVAGYLMDTRILTFHPDSTVEEVLNKLREVGDQRFLNIYITDTKGELLGKALIQTIAISPSDMVLRDLMKPCASVQVMTPAEEVVNLFQEEAFINLPVVDLSNQILGIIWNDALVAAAQKDASEDVLTMFGAGREERALSSPWLAVKKRLPWLEINLATAFLAASVVGIFEETIAKVTVLAVFLPVVAGQSGNTGSQALAVTMRGLALREIQIGHWWKVARKEVTVGFVNGVAVAFTTALIVYFWASSFGLALVIGTSMVLSMVIAGFSGAIVPMVLKAFGQDPAQSSSIVLTTITDITGFFSFLGLTTALGAALGII